MQPSWPLLTDCYDYQLPQELIATEPANPRDSARLMVIDRASGAIEHARFHDLLTFLPKGLTALYNDTQVIKARLYGTKETGGKIELFINRPLTQQRFNVLIRGRVKSGMRINFDKGLWARVEQCEEDGSRIVSFFDADAKILDFETLLGYLNRLGHMPLPPYIKRAESAQDAQAYQTIFAQKAGAVAAPTASLHFTKPLFAALQTRHLTYPITLHVGAGTFKPVETKYITQHPMHCEYYEIPPQASVSIDSQAPLLAIGTTVARTIEHYIRTNQREGLCDLFLHPANPPRRINALLTNFHLPKSTLLMLVASFLGVEKTMRAYHIAIQKRYRFYSYGDAMLII